MAEALRLPVRYAVASLTMGIAISAAVWSAAFLMPLSPPPAVDSPAAIVATSIGSACLFTLLLMIEAVAHERLVTDSFNPLAQRDSERMKVNQRVLQNTLEELPLFAAGIAMIVSLFPIETAFRATIAATLVWIVSRWVFWIGYQLGPQHRIAGMVGLMQSMIVVVAASAVLGWRLGGWAAAVVVPGLYSLGEAVVVAGLLRRR